MNVTSDTFVYLYRPSRISDAFVNKEYFISALYKRFNFDIIDKYPVQYQ